MKRVVLSFLIILSIGMARVFGQCDPAYEIATNLFVNHSGPPPCWSTNNNSGVSWSFTTGEVWINAALTGFSQPRGTVILPEALNAQGTLTFDAIGENGFIPNPHDGLAVGVMDNAGNFIAVHNVVYSETKQSFSFSFANYFGTGNKIAIARTADNKSRCRISNVVYTSLCPASPEVIARTNDITIQLDASGNASITPADINNGSSNVCEELIPEANLALDKTSFTTSDLGQNVVTLTALGASGNIDTETAIVTVEPTIVFKAGVDTVYLDGNGEAILSADELLDVNETTAGVAYTVIDSVFDCSEVLATVSGVRIQSVVGTDTVLSKPFAFKILDTIAPTVIPRDLVLALEASTGMVSITTDQVSNGSSDNCSLVLSLSKSTFGCEDHGVNEVILTGVDPAGNTVEVPFTVTINSRISDDALSSPTTTFCPDVNSPTAATITLDSSVMGVSYLLRNGTALAAGPVAGTGAAIDFNVTGITSTSTFNVIANLPEDNGGALKFGAVEDKLSADIPPSFDYSDGYTFESWLNINLNDNANTNKTIFAIGNPTQDDIEIYVNRSDELTILHNRNNGATQAFVTYTGIPNNTDFHMAVVMDGDTATLYIDGVSQGEKVLGTNAIVTPGMKIEFGAFGNAVTFPQSIQNFNGTMDDIRLWDDVRTATEIQDNYTKGIAASSADLSLYYDFEDGTALDSVMDVTGNSNAAILNGNASTQRVDGLIKLTAACSRTLSQTVTIGDDIAPVANGRDTVLTLGTDGTAMLDAAALNDASTDNCTDVGDLTYTLSKTDFTCEDIGTMQVILTVTDEAGNADQDTIQVTVASAINAAMLTVDDADICNGNITITTPNSLTGVFYELQDTLGNTLQSVQGTGASIGFDVANVNSDTAYVVQASLAGKDKGLFLGAARDQIRANVPFGFNAFNGYTIEAWINADFTSNTSVNKPLFCLGYAQFNNIELYVQASTQRVTFVHDRRKDRSPNGLAQWNPGTIPSNQLTHVALVFNDETNQVILYVDGQSAGSRTMNANPFFNSNSYFHFGDFELFAGSIQRFDGTFDEIRIWENPRTATEIADNYTKKLTGTEPDLVAYYDFEQASATFIPHAGRGNNASVVRADTSTVIAEGAFDIPNENGCSVTFDPVVIKTDSIAPVARAKDAVLSIAGGSGTLTVEDVNNGSSDNCTAANGLILSLSKTAFTSADPTENIVTLYVEDANGNIDSTMATVTLTTKAAQTISFPVISNKVYGNGNFNISATASSGLPVSYRVVSGPAEIVQAVDIGPIFAINQGIAVISADPMNADQQGIKITGAGTVVIEANQAGNDSIASVSVQQSFDVAKAALTIRAEDKTITLLDPIPALTYQIIGLVNDDTEAGEGITVDISTTADSSLVGVYPISISGTTDTDNYTIAYSNASLTVTNKKVQTLDFPLIGNKTYGDADFPLGATSSEGLPVSYRVVSGPAELINGDDNIGKDVLVKAVASFEAVTVGFSTNSTLRIMGAGEVTVEAIQLGNDSVSATDTIPQTFTINKAALTLTADDITTVYQGSRIAVLKSARIGVVDPVKVIEAPIGGVTDFTFSAQGLVNGDSKENLGFTPSISSTATSSSNAGTYPITITGQASTANYNITYVDGTYTINKADQTINFPGISDRDVTAGAINLTVATTSGLPLGVGVEGPIDVLRAGDQWTITPTQAGVATITVRQLGNNNYNAAPEVIRTFNISDARCNDVSLTLVSKVNATENANDGSIDLALTGATEPVVVSWSHGDSVLDVSGLSAGVYSVGIVDANNCPASITGIEIITENITAIDHEDEIGLKVFPVPTDGYLTVTAKTPLEAVAVVNQLGETVHAASMVGGVTRTSLDLRMLSGGIYTLIIYTDKGMYTEKVVISN